VYKRFWHRLLHDRTADEMARAMSQLQHVNVTQIPYHLGAPSLTVEHLQPDGDRADAPRS
jgi:hypothetical protein